MKQVEISIYINDKNDIINIYNEDRISNELKNYIYHECFYSPIKKYITINIKSKINFNEKEKIKIVDMMRSSFGHSIKEDMIYLKHDKVRAFYLFLMGIIFLLLSKSILNEFIISEVLLIIGWVSIWEATYNFIFEDNKRRIRIKRLQKLTKCKINFE